MKRTERRTEIVRICRDEFVVDEALVQPLYREDLLAWIVWSSVWKIKGWGGGLYENGTR
jgi:hypothetical protein